MGGGSFGNLALASLLPPASFPELYQELWWYSGGNTAIGNAGSAGNAIQKGSGSSLPSFSSSQTHLFTLGSNWNVSQQCAFEATLWTSGAYTCNAELWDITAGSVVSGSAISTTSTSAIVVRSGKFTLIPSHSYGITYWSVTGSGTTVYLTDASLIVFPPAGSTAPNLSSISLANPSGNTLKDVYIPLWVYSSASGASSATTDTSNNYVSKGSNGSASSSSSASKLYNHSANWNPNQRFAFECSIYSGASGYTASAELWDMTGTPTKVAGSTVSVTSNAATLIRSGQFTLVPGHSYGVVIWSSTTSYNANLTKAHLVALGS